MVVDLNAGKNTQQILAKLNECYPFAKSSVHTNVQKYLSKVSYEITQAAIDAIQAGDTQQLGNLMRVAQAEFDAHLIPACPEQLTAPVLHNLLDYQPIQRYILGGKGVGSQGDGTAQFLVENEESQRQVINIIERDFPQMQCLKLTIYVSK